MPVSSHCIVSFPNGREAVLGADAFARSALLKSLHAEQTSESARMELPRAMFQAWAHCCAQRSANILDFASEDLLIQVLQVRICPYLDSGMFSVHNRLV